MAINFTVGEYVVINRAYVEKILPTLGCSCNNQTLSSLGYVGANPSVVLATGTVFVNATMKSYIQVRPANTGSPAFKNQRGVIIYFCSDAHLNNSLELSTAFIDDKCYIKAQNVSGSPITKGQLVYQAGFDGTLQLPNVSLAAATASSTCAALGLASADIGIAECGSILIEGSFVGFDTSSFTNVGQTVFLSDTPGAISSTAGTIEKVVARVASISATDGTIILDGVTAGSGGGGGSAGATGIGGLTGIQGATGIGAGGGSGFFTDGTGTNAGIGKGATAPTAAGNNSIAQGDSSTAGGDNSFSLGTSNQAEQDNTFAQGISNVSTGTGGVNNMVQGQTNRTYFGRNSFSQGYNNYLHGASANYQYQGFIQGQDNVIAYSSNSFCQGRGNVITNSYSSFIQGYSNAIDSGGHYSFIQGDNCYTYGPGSFAQGKNVRVGPFTYSGSIGYNSTAYANYSFCIGSTNYTAAENSFAQGYNNYTSGSGPGFAQGFYNRTGGVNTFSQGRNNYVYGSQMSIQGLDNSWSGGQHENIFVQGYANNFTGTYRAYQIFAQGSNISVGGEANNCFAQGYDINIRGSDDSFFQGRSHSTDGNPRARVFVQGAYGLVQNDDQKVWGSNRTLVGGAQSSKIVTYENTVNATPRIMASITTDTDKSYLISCKMVARNTTTNAETATFVLSQACVYNDTGTAVLIGTPAFTQVDSGGGASSFACDIAVSTSNFEINITGDATDTVQWCMDLEYVEVAG